MADVFDAAIDRLFTIAEATITEIKFTFDGHEANRWAWRELIERFEKGDSAGGIETPFICIDMLPAVQADDWGATGFYWRVPVLIWYFTSIHDAAGKRKDAKTINVECANVCMRLARAILAHHTTDFIALDCHVDISQSNEANAMLSKKNMPFYAAVAKPILLVGESP